MSQRQEETEQHDSTAPDGGSVLRDTTFIIAEQYAPAYLERLPDVSDETQNVDAAFMASDYIKEHLSSGSYTLDQALGQPREWYKVPVASELAELLPGVSLYLVVGHTPVYWYSFFGLKDGQVYLLPGYFKSLLSACGVQFAASDVATWVRVLTSVLVGNGEFDFEAFPPYAFEFHDPFISNGTPAGEWPQARREAILSGERPLCPSITIDSVVVDKTSEPFGWWTVEVHAMVNAANHILRVTVVPYVGGKYYPLSATDSEGKYGHDYLIGAGPAGSVDFEESFTLLPHDNYYTDRFRLNRPIHFWGDLGTLPIFLIDIGVSAG